MLRAVIDDVDLFGVGQEKWENTIFDTVMLDHYWLPDSVVWLNKGYMVSMRPRDLAERGVLDSVFRTHASWWLMRSRYKGLSRLALFLLLLLLLVLYFPTLKYPSTKREVPWW